MIALIETGDESAYHGEVEFLVECCTESSLMLYDGKNGIVYSRAHTEQIFERTYDNSYSRASQCHGLAMMNTLSWNHT